MNAPIVRLFGLVIVLFAVLIASRRAGRCSTRRGAARPTRSTSARCSRSSDQARHDPRRRRHSARRLASSADGHLPRAAIRRRPVRPARRLLVRRPRRCRPRAATTTTELTGRTHELAGIVDSLLGRKVGDDLDTTLDAEGAAARLRRGSPGGRARSWRWTSRPAPCGCWPATRDFDTGDPSVRRQRRHAAVNRATQGLLSARLDLQGRDRHRRARHRPLHAGLQGRPARTTRSSRACRCSNFGGENFGDIT